MERRCPALAKFMEDRREEGEETDLGAAHLVWGGWVSKDESARKQERSQVGGFVVLSAFSS